PGLRAELLGQPVEHELELRVEGDERLPARDDARLVGPRDDVLAVDEVLRRAAGDPDPERAAALRVRAQTSGLGRARERTAREDDGAAGRRAAEQLVASQAGLEVVALVAHLVASLGVDEASQTAFGQPVKVTSCNGRVHPAMICAMSETLETRTGLRTIQAVDRAAALLKAVAASRRPLTVVELAAA